MGDILFHKEDFGGLVFVPTTGDILRLNHAGYELFAKMRAFGKLQVTDENLLFWRELEKKLVVKEVIRI